MSDQPQPQPQPRFCINCKHIGRNGSGDALRFKCFAEQNVVRRTTDLVTGKAVVVFVFESCYDARLTREASCGAEGKWFEPAPPAVEAHTMIATKPGTRSPIDLLHQLDSMK